MLLLSLELSVDISDTESLPLSLHCCSSPRMNTGVHLNTSPAGIVCVAVALLCEVVVTFEETVVPADETGSISTISVPENFCAKLSMFLLKVSLRSELRPNFIGLDDNFDDFEYKFSVWEETALFAVGFVSTLWQTLDDLCFSESFLEVAVDKLVWCSVLVLVLVLVLDFENDFAVGEAASWIEDWSIEGQLSVDNDGRGSSNMANHGCCRHSVTVNRSLENDKKNSIKVCNLPDDFFDTYDAFYPVLSPVASGRGRGTSCLR